jgi:hypothetical protein
MMDACCDWILICRTLKDMCNFAAMIPPGTARATLLGEKLERLAGVSRLVMPMAGEIGLTTATKITRHAATTAENDRTQLHFYTALPNVPDAVWNAIRPAWRASRKAGTSKFASGAMLVTLASV